MPDIAEGWPEPPGVTADATGANVAVVAPDAWAVEFCLFDATGTTEVARHRLPGRTGAVHHGWIAGLRPGDRYGLRAHGPWDPEAGHRFDPAKLLLDPWATAIDRPFRLHPTLFARGEGSAAAMPKAIIPAPGAPALPPPPVPGPRVIYELHVRGFTKLHPEIPEPIRGTFAALGHPAAIAHLQALGITHVELMPCAAGIDERHLPALGLNNHWNYNPVAFLAPDPRLAPGGMAEVRAAVEALRRAGIGVILDVVFNHSGEGDAFGPTLSLRGLSDAAFHRVLPGGRYANHAGCGNTLALDRPWPLRLAMDAMRHWVRHGGVAGFRLDLGVTLGRRAAGFDADAPLLQAMRQDSVLRERLIVAEPWDIGPDGYRLGAFPPGWGEWNDRFRDTVRRFWRGDAGLVGDLATRLAGSADLLAGRRVTDSVNYVTAHDGFTLADLVAFTEKRNHANGEHGHDGHNENHSWNCGVEGPTDDPAILARRAGDVRALLATLLVARGTPMLSMGDEGGRTQRGNNNAYAQDNPVSWLDWAGMDEARVAFTARLVAARRTHPALTADRPLAGTALDDTGLPDVAWRRPDGAPMTEADWQDPARRALVAVLYEPARGAAPADRVLVALNGGAAECLVLPPPRAGFAWTLLADSAMPERSGPVGDGSVPLAPRAVLLLAEAPAAPPQRAAADPALLRQLAGAAGIDTAWHDLAGREHQVPEGTLRHLLGALGLPAETLAQARESLGRLTAGRILPATWTLRAGQPAALPVRLPHRPLTLLLEDGAVQELRSGAGQRDRSHRWVALPPLPPGCHRLRAGDATCHLIAAPAAGFLPGWAAAGGRRFGIAAQSYALRRAGDQGVGDTTAVAALAALAGREGAALLGLSPPHALIPTDRERASPYQPSDRRFLEPALIDVAALPGHPAVRAALAEAEPVFAALRARPLVDWPAAWTAKRGVLAAAFAALGEDRVAFDAFLAAGGPALARFCAFTATAEALGHTDLARWPADLRSGDGAGVAAAAESEAGRFVAFQQWVADRQWAAAAAVGPGLYRDLAVGPAPDGAEVWSGDQPFLRGASVGAPPDAFAPEGQVWGLPAPDPLASAASGHAGFAALLRANMRHAAALRIDHVMGLARLFLVPEGAPGVEGAYLRYPVRDLLGLLALESTRAGCLVVGEDLGTVPPGLREELAAARVLSYRVLWFERRGAGFIPPGDWPPHAAACVSTHDLPTFAGWRAGADLAERAALGLLAEGAEAARAVEQAALDALLAAEDLPASAAGAHALVARTPCALALIQAEDLAGETVAVNLPGTDRERPNWRRRLAVPVEELAASPGARAILDAVRAERPPGAAEAFH